MSNAKPAAASRGPKLHTRRLDALVLLAYGALSLAMAWPLPLRLDSAIPGRQADARVFQWNNWWVKRALFEGQNPLYTDRFYYPTGAGLAGHNLNWVSSFLSVPLDLIFGPTVAYNLLFLLTLWGSGFAMYLLVRYLVRRSGERPPPQPSPVGGGEATGARSLGLPPVQTTGGIEGGMGRAAAFLAGLVFAFFPYHLSGNWDGQMNLANTQWLPLALWFLLRTLDHRRIQDALLCGLFVALSGLDCWFFLPFLGLWGLVWLAYSLIWERDKWSWRLVGLLGLAALVGGLLIAPALWPLLAESGGETVGEAVDYFAAHKASDLWAFFVPSSDHPLMAEAAAPAYARFAHWRPAYLGYTVLLLALYALLCARCREPRARHSSSPPWFGRGGLRGDSPQALLWATSGSLFAWLALGTTLRVGGVERPGAPMLLAGFIKVLPAFKLIRQPSRFGVMVGLSLAVLVGLACADLLRRLARPHLRAGLGVLLGALILFEYLGAPVPLLPARVSPWYDQLAQEPDDCVIVELPLGLLTSGHALYGQTVHGKRLVNGYVARASSDVNPFVLSNPLLKAFYLRFDPSAALSLDEMTGALGVLAANDVRYIVIHKGPLPPLPAVETHVLDGWRRTFEELDREPVYEDGELVVYSTGPGLDRTGWPVADLGSGLQLASLSTYRVEHQGRHQLQIDVVWRTVRDLERDLDLVLSLREAERENPAPTTLAVGARSSRPWRISPHFPTSRWKQGVVVAERYALLLPPSLAGGAYTLVLDLPGVGSTDLPVQLTGEAQPLTAGLDADHLTDVTFGEQMRLLGYQWTLLGEQAALDLGWQALDAMGTNYKVFVHLLNAQGEIVAQVDTMPRGWSYPTTLWSRQELFRDRIVLPVQDLPPGAYRAALGVYRPETGRLPALDAQGTRIADDRVILDVPLEIPK